MDPARCKDKEKREDAEDADEERVRKRACGENERIGVGKAKLSSCMLLYVLLVLGKGDVWSYYRVRLGCLL